MGNFASMYVDAGDIYNFYWDTDVNVLVGALATGTTGATVNSKLTKTEYTNMMILCENLNKMFTNVSISTTDHLLYINGALYGTSSISTIVGNNVENLGDRLKALAWQCMNVYNACKFNKALYFDNEVGDIVSALDAQRVLPGCSVTQSDMAAAITLMQDFIDFVENAAVTQADYKATVSKWMLY